MRKTIVVLIILILVGSAGAYLYLKKPAGGTRDMASILPADTVAVIRVCELKKQIDRFKAGKMGQSLASIDLPRLMTAMEVPANQQQEVMNGIDRFRQTVESAWFDTLFGQDIAVTVQRSPLDTTRLAAGDPELLKEAVTIVARPKQPALVLESLNTMFASQLNIQTEPYKEWTINRFDPEEGVTVYYALTQGLMVAGLSPAPVQRSLDQSLDEATSLVQQPAYRKYCADLYKTGQTDFIIYLNLADMMETLMAAVEQADMDQAEAAAVKNQLAQLQGIETINCAGYDDGGPLVSWKTIVGIDRQHMSPTLIQTTRIAPSANPTLKHVPADVLLYSWQNNFDLSLYWRQLQENPEITPEMVAQIRNTVQAQTGLAIEQLLAAIGTQAGLLVNSVNMDGLFPIPELALFFQVSQADLIDRLLQDQVGRLGMPLQTESHDAAVIQYLMLPMGGNLSPAYTITDGFCTVAINRNLLKSMLDAESAGPLAATENFKALDHGLSDKNNQMFYMQPEALTAKTREILKWAMAWMAMAKPEDVDQVQQVITLGIDPLLDGLAMVITIGGRAYMQEDHIRSEVHMLLDRS